MIDRFRDEYAFLSNFAPQPPMWLGPLKTCFWNVETAYQAAKVPLDHPCRDDEQGYIAGLSAVAAKRYCRRQPLRPDWQAVRIPLMRGLLRLKFANRRLGQQLLATLPHELVEGNDWGDTFWGVCRGQGENHLGRLLMELRATL